MPRKQVNDLPDVQLGGAARQVNTFVYAPRAPRTNSALELSATLSGVAKQVEQHQEREYQLDVKQATANKLYGGTLFTSTVDEATADYETNKDKFQTVDDAAAFYLARTTPEEPFPDAHQEAGFKEAQAKALGKFRGAHAQYLAGKRQEQLGRDVLNDFLLETKTSGTGFAFTRLRNIADNYGMSKDEMDKIPLSAAKIAIAQGNYDEAEAILTDKRGGAGSLVDRSHTAEEAGGLLDKTLKGREDAVTAQAKDLRNKRRLNEIAQVTEENRFVDEVLSSSEMTYEQKALELNKAELTGRVSDEFATEFRRVLKSEDELTADSDPVVIADLVQRIYDVNTLSEEDPEQYLTGVNNINKEVLQLRSGGKISANDFKKVQKQIKTLTSSKVSEATRMLPRVYRNARNNIEQQLPPEYRGEALRELYDSTEQQRQELVGTENEKEELEKLYKRTSNTIIQQTQEKRRKKAQEALAPYQPSEEDKAFLDAEGISMDAPGGVKETARNRGVTEQEVIRILKEQSGYNSHTPLLDKIGEVESGSNYNVIVGGEEHPLTDMTVKEVLKLQERMKDDGKESTAVGKYQIINKTLKSLIEEEGIKPDQKFDQELQDNLGKKLLERRGLKDWKEGSLSTDDFLLGLSQEWAALPKDSSNKSYYDGKGSNKSRVAYNDMAQLLNNL